MEEASEAAALAATRAGTADAGFVVDRDARRSEAAFIRCRLSVAD
jgi:hypothetical protein